jgi:transcriptional regulator with XRE-family HTH domain
MARTRDFAKVIRQKLATDSTLAKGMEVESFNADLATKLYESRTAAGLTQKELAHLAGTHQSVISRIEDADYDGHSLTLLRKIAAALSLKVRVEFCDENATAELIRTNVTVSVSFDNGGPSENVQENLNDSFSLPAGFTVSV